MERLSNIMRTAQGPYMAAQQRLPQQQGQGQRQSPPMRRPLPPEQSGRQGGPTRSLNAHQARPTLPPRASQGRDEQWEEPAPLPARPLNRESYNNPPLPRVPQPSRYAEHPPQGDYYEEDEPSTIIPSHAQEKPPHATTATRHSPRP